MLQNSKDAESHTGCYNKSKNASPVIISTRKFKWCYTFRTSAFEHTSGISQMYQSPGSQTHTLETELWCRSLTLVQPPPRPGKPLLEQVPGSGHTLRLSSFQAVNPCTRTRQLKRPHSPSSGTRGPSHLLPARGSPRLRGGGHSRSSGSSLPLSLSLLLHFSSFQGRLCK